MCVTVRVLSNLCTIVMNKRRRSKLYLTNLIAFFTILNSKCATNLPTIERLLKELIACLTPTRPAGLRSSDHARHSGTTNNTNHAPTGNPLPVWPPPVLRSAPSCGGAGSNQSLHSDLTVNHPGRFCTRTWERKIHFLINPSRNTQENRTLQRMLANSAELHDVWIYPRWYGGSICRGNNGDLGI